MACQYTKTCPSATGWCEGAKSKPEANCVLYILTAYNNLKDSMTGNEYQKLAARTINKDLTYHNMADHALHGMVGEIGEIHSIYQKIYQGHELEFDHIEKELGDLLWFIAEYCTAFNMKLEDVMRLNIEKLKARYPEGFDAEHSLHRTEGDI